MARPQGMMYPPQMMGGAAKGQMMGPMGKGGPMMGAMPMMMAGKGGMPNPGMMGQMMGKGGMPGMQPGGPRPPMPQQAQPAVADGPGSGAIADAHHGARCSAHGRSACSSSPGHAEADARREVVPERCQVPA